MHKELKIVISIVLVYVVFGLNSLFVNGGFVTPFLYSKFILFGTSLAFLLLNLRIKGYGWLIWSLFAFMSLALVDEFTIGYLDQLFKTNSFDKLTSSSAFIYTVLICFYGFLYAQLYPFYKYVRHKIATVFLLMFLTLHLLLLINGFPFYAYLAMNIYLLGYFIIYSRLYKGEKTVLDALTAQALGLFLLELFKYAA